MSFYKHLCLVADEQKNEPRSYLCKFIHDYGLQYSLNYITETNLNMLKPGDYSANEMFRLIVKLLINEVYLFLQGLLLSLVFLLRVCWNLKCIAQMWLVIA